MKMRKILVVDDEEDLRKILGEILRSEGYYVIFANSGEMCLEILKKEKPDLILMDIMMPGMDGWEVVQKIKEDESNKGIKISMLTVKSMKKDMAKSLAEVDADWHMSKPISREELLKTVGALLG
jgi:CheY-like chemotaxis protein